MTKHLALILVSIFIFSGCATSNFHRGVVAMKINDSVAHVGLNRDEVAIGDHVELYASKCTGVKDSRTCKKVGKGHGVVTDIINDNYVAVKFDPGTVFNEGDFVEKHSH